MLYNKCMQDYASSKYNSKYKFSPRKPVKTFRDLDVYNKMLECSVLVMKDVHPKLVKLKYPFIEGIMNCTMSVPLFIGEAHSIRFGNFAAGLALMEKSMSGCNKMIIYLEHIKGMYGDKADVSLIDDLIIRYADSRTKAFHLELSWKKWSGKNKDGSLSGKINL